MFSTDKCFPHISQLLLVDSTEEVQRGSCVSRIVDSSILHFLKFTVIKFSFYYNLFIVFETLWHWQQRCVMNLDAKMSISLKTLKALNK
jgi:hypothetical protein